MNHPPLILISCGTVPHPMSPRRSLSVLYGGALERAGCLGAAWTGGRRRSLPGALTACCFPAAGIWKHPCSDRRAIRARETPTWRATMPSLPC